MITYIAVLLVMISPGNITSVYIGEFDSAAKCEAAGTQVVQQYFPNNQTGIICTRKETA